VREISEWHVQAAIASTYGNAESSEAIDWAVILGHYDQLVTMTRSPVVALNRAVAVLKVHGAEAALAALAPLESHAAMAGISSAACCARTCAVGAGVVGRS
jgi:RNA polymerase sigma-70 factor (ECF subfamily)